MQGPVPAYARYYRQEAQPVNGCPRPYPAQDMRSGHTMEIGGRANLDLLFCLLYAPPP